MVIPEGEVTETFFKKQKWKSNFSYKSDMDWARLQTDILDAGYAFAYSRRHFLGYVSVNCTMGEEDEFLL